MIRSVGCIHCLCFVILCKSLSLCEAHSSVAYNHEPNLETDRSTWMSKLNDSTHLASLSLLGTHDSMSLRGGFATVTQSLSLDKQLVGGVRVFDIRVRMYQNTFPIHHGPIFQVSLVSIIF